MESSQKIINTKKWGQYYFSHKLQTFSVMVDSIILIRTKHEMKKLIIPLAKLPYLTNLFRCLNILILIQIYIFLG